MKFSALVKTILTGALVAGLSTIAFEIPASAQVETSPGVTDGTTGTTAVQDQDDGFDWGLLGLLGLLGLAGLARKSDDRVTTYRDPQTTSTTTTRSDPTNLR
ncbi:WGxxGxxG family protein [Thermocoleostomius sinensis]|jgi:MYXO-CTERM domain-containing protein|uniref:WGxxGxxG-CTERM domain-containing protein n=1 Tax=Thermocoleostomius sinensis A174 TaxID=2016057 RepID=A0A9E8ZGT3_9CYAN|nr:WGxxGxxG family protein [Thermocoleostomius sinensis]WAL58256.1 WGxxGxxG-CTERM domain-containing protein [Thermocoleostomius sinensis A174]